MLSDREQVDDVRHIGELMLARYLYNIFVLFPNIGRIDVAQLDTKKKIEPELEFSRFGSCKKKLISQPKAVNEHSDP